MKKPKLLQTEWHKMAGGAVITKEQEFICQCVTMELSNDEIRLRQNIISQVPHMIDALIELVFLNQCDLEGLRSGQPTPGQWRKAFEKAEQVLINAGCSNE